MCLAFCSYMNIFVYEKLEETTNRDRNYVCDDLTKNSTQINTWFADRIKVKLY